MVEEIAGSRMATRLQETPWRTGRGRMLGQAFAAWVRPVASALMQDRQAVIAFARSAPGDLWGQPSGLAGWTCRDILAHLAGGNDLMLQRILRSITAGQTLDPGLLRLDTEIENERGVEERRGWTFEALITELERDGEEVQTLLARLTDEDEAIHLTGLSISLGRFLQVVAEERHDLIHLEQLRAGPRPVTR